MNRMVSKMSRNVGKMNCIVGKAYRIGRKVYLKDDYVNRMDNPMHLNVFVDHLKRIKMYRKALKIDMPLLRLFN